MMYCPNCKQEYEGKFCPECRTKLIEKPSGEGGVSLNLGDANAISGGLHVNDSHAVHNEDKSVHNITNTTSTVNNITQMSAQKTEIELLQERKAQYLSACKRAYEDNVLDLPTLLMDLALEYQLREEEIIFHAKQQRISTMQTSVLDEDHIMLDAIDEATVERIIKESEQKGLDKEQTFKVLAAPWMEAIHDYLAQMTSKYKDFVFMFNLEIEPDVNGCSSSLFTRTGKYKTETGIVPQVPFKKLCEERQLEVSYTFSKNPYLKDPSRRQTVACFTVEDSEIIIDEVLYDQLWHKDQLIIYPNAKDRRFQLQISGSIGLHALVGYLKQMPALCQQMNKFAESLKL